MTDKSTIQPDSGSGVTTRRREKLPPPWVNMTWPERIFFCIKVPVRAIWCTSNIAMFFLVYFGFMLPVVWFKTIWPRLYWGYEGKLYRWLMAFIGYWGYTAGYDVEFGDDVKEYGEEDRVLLMVNHQSTADVPVLMAILQSKGVASRKMLWLMDIMFRWSPFGIIGHNHGDYFIKQGKATREKELDRLKKHLSDVFWDRDRRWIILFPEGGFFYKRVESSQRYAKANGFPHLEHTTLPRMGAVKAILETCGPREEDNAEGMVKSRSNNRLKLLKDTVSAIREKKYVKDRKPPIKYVLDVTIAYSGGHPLSLATLACGTRQECDIGVNYKIYKADDVPFNDEDKLRDWMYERYVEKDKMLDTYYKEGVFHVGEQGVPLHFPYWKIIGQYCFWFASFYVQYKVYGWIVCQLWGLFSSIIAFVFL